MSRRSSRLDPVRLAVELVAIGLFAVELAGGVFVAGAWRTWW